MRVVVYKENKNFQREREYHIFINSYEFIGHVYPFKTNTCA